MIRAQQNVQLKHRYFPTNRPHAKKSEQSCQNEIYELKCFSNLNEIKDSIDIINIFRHPDHVLPIVNDSIKINPKVIWFQDGVVNYEAIDLANKNGIQTIVDDCIYRRHKEYINST